MNAIKKVLVASPLAMALMSLGLPALAAVTANTINSPVQNSTDIQNLLCNIIGWFIWVVIIISVIMVVYAAFEYATAAGDAEKIATGRKTITYAAVGIVVALCAAGVPSIVNSIFGSTASFGITCLGI
jgi:hypothetical protein